MNMIIATALGGRQQYKLLIWVFFLSCVIHIKPCWAVVHDVAVFMICKSRQHVLGFWRVPGLNMLYTIVMGGIERIMSGSGLEILKG